MMYIVRLRELVNFDSRYVVRLPPMKKKKKTCWSVEVWEKGEPELGITKYGPFLGSHSHTV